jgi:solute carrier family 25 folate transporter 32
LGRYVQLAQASADADAVADETDPEGNQSSLPPSTILICSAASKMIASLATYPHEVLRTRLQIAKASASSTSTSTSSTSSLSSASSSSASSSGSGGTRPHLYSPLVTGSQPPPRLPFTEIPMSANTWINRARRRKGGIVDTALKIKRQDGWRGFYRGLSINLVRTVPNSAVTMLS